MASSNEKSKDKEHEPLSAEHLKKQYSRWIVFFAAGLFITFIIAGLLTYQREKQRLMNDLHMQTAQLQDALTQQIDQVRNHVNAMQTSIERSLGDPSLNDAGFLSRIERRNPAPLHGLHWENLPQSLSQNLGALYLDPAYDSMPGSNIAAASSALPEMVAIHKRYSDFLRSYFHDDSEHWNLSYPPRNRDPSFSRFAPIEVPQTVKIWYSSQGVTPLQTVNPANNARREMIWIRPYFDPSIKGMVASLLAPVYLGDAYQGAVGTDISLNLLGNPVLQHPLNMGRALIVDGAGTVLADSGGALLTASAPVMLDQILPQIAAELKMAEGKSNPEGLSRLPLNGTPWFLLVYPEPSEIRKGALGVLWPVLGLLMLSLAGLLGVLYLQDRRYANPAMLYASYVHQLDENPRRPIPAVPSQWKPLMTEAAMAAHDRHDFAVATLQRANQIEGTTRPMQYESGLDEEE